MCFVLHYKKCYRCGADMRVHGEDRRLCDAARRGSGVFTSCGGPTRVAARYFARSPADVCEACITRRVREERQLCRAPGTHWRDRRRQWGR